MPAYLSSRFGILIWRPAMFLMFDLQVYIVSVSVIRGEGRGQASNLLVKGKLKPARVGVE